MTNVDRMIASWIDVSVNNQVIHKRLTKDAHVASSVSVDSKKRDRHERSWVLDGRSMYCPSAWSEQQELARCKKALMLDGEIRSLLSP